MLNPLPLVTRQELAKVFTDPRTLLGVEQLLLSVARTVPDAVTEALETAEEAIVEAEFAQATADLALIEASAAQADVDAVKAVVFIVAAPDADVPNARQLAGGLGVTIDLGTPGVARVVVNVPVALGYTPANRAGDTFTGPVTASDLTSGNEIAAGSFVQTGAVPVASLPTAAAAPFARMAVTDSTLPYTAANIGAPVVGGGAEPAPVISLGGVWVIG